MLANLVQRDDGDTVAQLPIAEKGLGGHIRVYHHLQDSTQNCLTDLQEERRAALCFHAPSLVHGMRKTSI